MATSGTPYEGLDYIGARIYGSHLSLVAYTNTADSFSNATRYSNLSFPSGGGYAAITLSGTWTYTNGVVTYLHTGGINPRWNATGSWNFPVTGVAIVDVTSAKLLHFKDLTAAWTAASLRKLEVDLNTLLS